MAGLLARRRRDGGDSGRRGVMVAAVVLALVPTSGACAGVSSAAAAPTYDQVATRYLGPVHAAEHRAIFASQQRAYRRWRRLSPAARRRMRVAWRRKHARDARATQRAQRSAGPPDQVGAWTQAPFNIGTYAINAVLLPTGKVLYWSFPRRTPSTDPNPFFRPNVGRARLWDPSTGTITAVDPPRIDLSDPPNGTTTDPEDAAAPLFCSAQTLLPDGNVLVTGGNFRFPGDPNYDNNAGGLKTTFIFNSTTETWTRGPDMNQGRWYPTQTQLPDGRTLLLGGFTQDQPGGVFNTDLEVFSHPFDPLGTSTGTVALRANGARKTGLYPHTFVLPTGKVLLAGPGTGDTAMAANSFPPGTHDSALLDVAALDAGQSPWTDLPATSGYREGATAVLDPAGPAGSSKVTLIGGVDHRDDVTDVPALSSSETIDTSAPSPAWTTDASLNVPRSYGNTVLGPDGSMIEVGGAGGFDSVYETWRLNPGDPPPARQVEIKDAGASTWRLGPPQAEDRGYHSTALLLPDGRVFSAGDERFPDEGAPEYWSTFDTAEIYSPPYMFKGVQPTISSAPSTLHWADDFGVGADSNAARAVLVAPGAVTHANDMGQRVIPLQTLETVAGKGLNVESPPNANVAPPGYYMLFVLNPQGRPSLARWVRLGSDAPGAATLAADLPAGGGTPLLPPPAVRDRTAPHLTIRLASADLRAVRRTGRLMLRLAVNERATVRLAPRMSVRRNRHRRVLTGRVQSRTFGKAGSRSVGLVLGRALRSALSAGPRATVTVSGNATDPAGNVSRGTLAARLRLPKLRR